ncbi:MAG: hypothetical protein RMK20_10810 [Verrucomicrobiales bacterium]|nr:hypothetical protein [Verrucomicrobiales bacterium]
MDTNILKRNQRGKPLLPVFNLAGLIRPRTSGRNSALRLYVLQTANPWSAWMGITFPLEKLRNLSPQ